MLINVIDVESTCWEPKQSAIPSEIIQIGISTYDTIKREISPSFSMFVRPIFSTKLSDFCTQLTGITDEQVFDAEYFPAVIEYLQRNFNLKHRPWASWGDYDRRKFAQDADFHNMVYPIAFQHLNVKVMYSAVTGSKMVGVDKALEETGLGFVGRHHDGGDDAYNIARVLRYLGSGK